MRIKCDDFNLAATLDSGQVFGFTRDKDGQYSGRLLGHCIKIRQQNDVIHVENGLSVLPEDTVRSYFDLDRDLKDVYSILRSDQLLNKSFEMFKGLRLIRQDCWEALACFIISSNNNVKRIMGIYQNLVHRFGHFPSPRQVTYSHEKILRELGLGYRAPFLWSTAIFLCNNPHYLQTIHDLEYGEARARVISFPGIGPKVADCALLYGFHKTEAFPVDVWILRAMRKLYFRNRNVSADKIHEFGMKRWGRNAGYVQQYLFHSARMGVYDILPVSGRKNSHERA